jgi:hypothetical protein
MDMHLAAMPLTNATFVCVGGITAAEAENARSDGYDVDGFGYYLFLAEETAPEKPIQVLAKFYSSDEATAFARAIRGRST